MRPPESWRHARVTVAIAALTAAAWLVVTAIGQDEWARIWGGFIPLRAEVEAPGLAPFWLTPLTMTLVHAGFIHLAFNLVIHLFCGRSVEAVLGPWGLAILYVTGAYAAAAAHYLALPADPAPAVGASGAVSAVLGAYAILFGRNKVKLANPRLALLLHALWLMAAWVLLQMAVGFAFANAGDVRIAVAAHIGGFLAGLALAYPLLLLRYRKA